MICAICGLEIVNENVSKDHVYPRAIYKWQQAYLRSSDFAILKSAIESSSNIVKTHHKCNLSKEDFIIDINDLFISDKKRHKLVLNATNIIPYLDGYLSIKSKVARKQQFLCYSCQTPLTTNMILRRIDSRKPRTLENGCVLCQDCNLVH